MTLIDKADAHDDDLIRRGDIVPAVNKALAESRDIRDAIAALPARGVGVPESVRKFLRHDGLCGIVGGYGYCTCGLDGVLDALAPTEPPEEIGILRARVEDQATEIARLTRIIQMQPPAPTDAAQAREAAQADFVTLLTDAAAVAMKAREAALKEAADVVDAALMRWGFPSTDGCKRDEMRSAILALIGQAKPTLGECECGMTGPCMWDQCKHPLIGEGRE